MLVFFTRWMFGGKLGTAGTMLGTTPGTTLAKTLGKTLGTARGTMLCMLLLAPGWAHSAPKTVLVLGDSLSAEYGLARGAGWVALMDNKLKADKVAATIVNASISGETTAGGRTRLPALLATHKPALLVIELGANDGLRGLPVPSAEANLRAMVSMAQQTRAKVLLVGMRMPPNYGRAYTDSFFSMYEKVARELKTPLVPFMLAGVADKADWFQADRLHPAAQAHPTILANIYPTLLPLIQANAPARAR